MINTLPKGGVFIFLKIFIIFFKKLLTNRQSSVIMITEIKGSDLPLEAKYGKQMVQ